MRSLWRFVNALVDLFVCQSLLRQWCHSIFMASCLLQVIFIAGIASFIVGYLSIEYVLSLLIWSSKVLLDKNNTLFDGNTAGLDIPFERVIIFLEDGARPDFLFGSKVYREWKPFFTDLLLLDPNHTICTTMKVDAPTSTTQGVKTFLTGGMPSFIELGQTFYASTLRSDHLLNHLYQKGKKSISLSLWIVESFTRVILCGENSLAMYLKQLIVSKTRLMCIMMTLKRFKTCWSRFLLAMLLLMSL